MVSAVAERGSGFQVRVKVVTAGEVGLVVDEAVGLVLEAGGEHAAGLPLVPGPGTRLRTIQATTASRKAFRRDAYSCVGEFLQGSDFVQFRAAVGEFEGRRLAARAISVWAFGERNVSSSKVRIMCWLATMVVLGAGQILEHGDSCRGRAWRGCRTARR